MAGCDGRAFVSIYDNYVMYIETNAMTLELTTAKLMGKIRRTARAFSVKTELPKMLYPFDFEPVLIRKPPTLFGNML